MKKQDNQTIFTYRYVWIQKHKVEKPDSIDYERKMCVKLLSGPVAEHNIFMQALKDNENVVSAAREYVSHFDLRFWENDEFRQIKKEEK